MFNKEYIRKKAGEELKIDSVISKIEYEFEALLHLYGRLTEKISGKHYSIYHEGLFNYKDILKFDNIDVKVKPHGFSTGCFLVYKKGWFKSKSFYTVSGYSFYTEYDKSTRYDFTEEDYNIILSDLIKMISKLRQELSNEI